jgi:hypothetical protein
MTLAVDNPKIALKLTRIWIDFRRIEAAERQATVGATMPMANIEAFLKGTAVFERLGLVGENKRDTPLSETEWFELLGGGASRKP